MLLSYIPAEMLTTPYVVAECIIPIIFLWWCFPWYASVNKAYKTNLLSKGDTISFGLPFLVMGAIDVYCNILSSVLFVEPPFIHGITLSQRCSYWWNHPEDEWRHGLAHAVKVQTDKFEKNHIH